MSTKKGLEAVEKLRQMGTFKDEDLNQFEAQIAQNNLRDGFRGLWV